MATHRVMQSMETGEERCAYEGTARQCDQWIDDNADQYPESQFWVEPRVPQRRMYGGYGSYAD